MTITEGLAELKLISKKTTSKKQFVMQNLARPTHFKDPLGDSKKMIAEEIQSISDLNRRFVQIRSGIAATNSRVKLTVNGKTMTVQEWLTWKREVSEFEKSLWRDVHTNVKQALDLAASRPSVVKDEEGKTQLVQVEPNVDYPEFVKKEQETQDVLEKLDGQLSLLNATTQIDGI